jgi:hypothetical protein
MNEDTRVVINCYAGDQWQVVQKLGLFTHHECPVVTFSPEDAKVEIPGIESRFGGKVGYHGQVSLDRHDRQLEMLLEFPEKYFLFHDSDSICLDPKLPDYLYSEPFHLWSNIVNDNLEFRQVGYYPDGFPKLAFQPPYFLSRETVAKLLAVAKGITQINPALPLIDHYWVQLAVNAGVSWRGFPDGASHGISIDTARHANPPDDVLEMYKVGLDLAIDFARNRGGNIFHSIKEASPIQPLLKARRLYLMDHGDGAALLRIPDWWWVSAATADAAQAAMMAAAAEV